MSKHASKTHKQQASQNRLNTVTSLGQENPYQDKLQETGSSYREGPVISAQDIQRRAYEIYQQKGGSDIDNWLEAEKSLREEQHSVSK